MHLISHFSSIHDNATAKLQFFLRENIISKDQSKSQYKTSMLCSHFKGFGDFTCMMKIIHFFKEKNAFIVNNALNIVFLHYSWMAIQQLKLQLVSRENVISKDQPKSQYKMLNPHFLEALEISLAR